jgi:hypothetical protein
MKAIKIILISIGWVIGMALWYNWDIDTVSEAIVDLMFYSISPESYASDYRSELPRSAEICGLRKKY